MTKATYWADEYVIKQKTGPAAIALIKPGQRVFIGSTCGEPQYLVKCLAEKANHFTDLEIVRMMSQESTSLSMIAHASGDQALNIRCLYLGSAAPQSFAANRRFFTPINLSAVPRLFKSRRMPIHVALIQVSPPDDFGWMSLGISVDITLAAAQSADIVIAQVNSLMPRIIGRSFIHVNDVNSIVEYDEPLLTPAPAPDMATAEAISLETARLIEDGSTLHIDPGAAPQKTLLGLRNKNDLGIHTECITDAIMRLVAEGVITNRKKGYNEGRIVASSAMGSPDLYEFLNSNLSIDFQPSDYVNDPDIIARHHKMVSVCVAEAIDLTGQVAADAFRHNNYIGVTGMLDFVRGAVRSEGGKSILILPATAKQGKESRIVPQLKDLAVVVPRGDVDYVVSEFGMVRLFGKSLQERALAMISLAHPDFRDELFAKAKEMELLSPTISLSESLQGVYPSHLVEALEIKGQRVNFRAAKPVDVRRIQEHFYELDREDVVSRFFHERTRFLRNDLEGVYRIDYVKDLTIVGLVGEIGFQRAVAVGTYLFEESNNMAEIAFSVSKDWQGCGLGKILIAKLAKAARENGIAGLIAYTSPTNTGMLRLFNTLPYKIRSTHDANVVTLKCQFNEPI
ncbi:MAG: GNAT family N-acetyltransferase [Desulfobacterales bacterium]|jgi:acyl-CoA hydrolase/GNAT superfamily N-acetyltransferase|nr:GNAT family N-acetyltransferase [Desulfobacterales bacterium]